MAIKVNADTRKALVTSIKRYFKEELDQEIGDLKAELFLQFCLEEVGATVYNQAIADAQAYFQGKIEDLEGSCFEPELSYWEKSR